MPVLPPETLQTLALGLETLLPSRGINPFTLPSDLASDVAGFFAAYLGLTVIC